MPTVAVRVVMARLSRRRSKRCKDRRRTGSLRAELGVRDHEGMEGAESERESYRRIVSRAKRARERAAETLRRSRGSRKQQGDAGDERDRPPKQRRFRGRA